MGKSDIWLKSFYSALAGTAVRERSPEVVVEAAAKIATVAEKFIREAAANSGPNLIDFERPA